MEGIQSGGDKSSTEVKVTRMPTQDFQDLVKMMKKCFEDQRILKKNEESKDNDIEETSFNDAARWAMNQNKKV